MRGVMMVVLGVLLWAATGMAQTLLHRLHPQPRAAYERLYFSAVWSHAPGLPILVDPAAAPDEARAARDAAAIINGGFRARLLDTLEVRVWSADDSLGAGIFIGLHGAFLNTMLAALPDQRLVVTATYPGPEGYVLDCTPMRVLLVGSDVRGLRYGARAFAELFGVSPTGWLQPFRIVDAPEFPQRWFYHSTNIQVPRNVDAARALWARADSLRLNAVHLNDSKFARITTVPRFYLDSLTALVRHADALGLEIVPGVMPFGYSNAMLYHDPNYAAGLPVRAQRFVIEADTARLVPHRATTPPNGGFEQFAGNVFGGFRFVDAPGAMSFADTVQRHGGRASIRFENFAVVDPQNGNGRVSYWTRVAPFTLYHVRAWVRTENLVPSSAVNIAVLTTDGRSLAFSELGVPSTTGGWRQLDITFNSLDTDTLGVYWGVWGAREGRIWWDDLTIEEVPFVNLLRRPGTPLVVTHATSRVVYTEGVDYDTLRDPLLGVVPWSGEYTRWHTPPALRVRPGGALAAGDSIAVAYHHTVTIYNGQVTMTMSEPGLYPIIEREFRMLDSLVRPHSWFMQHDEIRVLNWEDADLARGLTPGQLLADNVRHCMEIIRRSSPASRVWVWSDMFDEQHNAVAKNYYLVNGDLRGSADLVPKDLGIVNWNGSATKSIPSMEFFSGRGFAQVTAPFYDADAAQIRRWRERMRGIAGVEGMMYTTWQSDYSELDAFADYAWTHAPHIRHTPPNWLAPGQPLAMYVDISGDRWDRDWRLESAMLLYRTAPHLRFTGVPLPTAVDSLYAIDLPTDAGTKWIQWYVTATDNRGFTSRVPLGDTVYYDLGALPTGVEVGDRPADFEILGVHPHPVGGSGAWVELRTPGGREVLVEVRDVLGRVVLRERRPAAGGTTMLQIGMSTLGPGVYMLTVGDGRGTRSRVVVRE